jgi:hypothetical protein
MPNLSEDVVGFFFGSDPSAKALIWVAFGAFLILPSM